MKAEGNYARTCLAYLELARHLLARGDRVEKIHAIGLIIKAQELLAEACKDNAIDSRNLSVANKAIEEIFKLLKPHETVDTGTVEIPESNSFARSGVRRRAGREQISDSGPGNIEKEMLMMAHDMRDAANVMHSTIRKDLNVLSATSDMQDVNLVNTQSQNASARNVRTSKRLGFLITIGMMILSLLIFISLVPLIIIT